MDRDDIFGKVNTDEFGYLLRMECENNKYMYIRSFFLSFNFQELHLL